MLLTKELICESVLRLWPGFLIHHAGINWDKDKGEIIFAGLQCSIQRGENASVIVLSVFQDLALNFIVHYPRG